ncbi:cation diffusion facilitator family transporter [Phaeacidiphilus oryzae]|uniref:cation diffusion facilitator family transporter n=1 Tax=Phaeacidiphilus oryzae TaxID=348818 RepID=UPI000A0767E0|nr:cation diffusion facilitator family transporter [Phaeacidiphilus oryzae]
MAHREHPDHKDGPAGHGEAGHAGHAGHAHGVSADADRRYLLGALSLIVLYMLAEVAAGLAAHSLALLSDAGHMLTDAASIALALLAMRLAARPARGRWTYGLKRAEILSAQINGITLLVLVVLFVIEAVRRLIEPPAVQGGLVLATSLAGIAVNIGAAWLLSRANRTSLNVEGAFQHILNDLWAFIATAASGLVVMLTGFARADAIASLIVAALMLRAGYALVGESWKIFLEGAPAGLEPARVGSALAAVPGVVEVHDLHIWTITSGFPALSAHVLVSPGLDCHAVRQRLEHTLRDELHIDHTTLQVDHAAPRLLTVGEVPPDDAPGPEDSPGAGDGAGDHCPAPHGETHRSS